MKFTLFFCATALLAGSIFPSFSQSREDSILKNPAYNWFNMDPQTDHTLGISTDKTYSELLKDRKPQQVIVAVIDGGVDSTQEDLSSVLWVNKKEIAGNGKDDDRNGYIDDVHGWNFIGGKDGMNVHHDTQEITRIVAEYDPLFKGRSLASIEPKQKRKFVMYQSAKKEYDSAQNKNQQQLDYYLKLYTFISEANETAKKGLNVSKVDSASLKGYKGSDPKIQSAVEVLLRLYGYGFKDMDNALTELKDAVTHFQDTKDYELNQTYNTRSIVGDTYSNLRERSYGNTNFTGPDALHGTHVSGIIAALRDNNLGIKGIANDVLIMPVRAVPDGDERDKDIANAIRYAVDNGAQIINMSFGKSFSPQKEAVDQAVKYAEQKGVLLIHAAGNESANKDSIMNYPTRVYLIGGIASNWIEVGASDRRENEKLAASFSNYGKKTVDVFAPGVDILSSVTKAAGYYKIESGTSMAAPVVTGMAAVLKEYFPELSPSDIRTIIMNSAIKYHTSVLIPGKQTMVPFDELSISGGIANLYNAVKMASTYKKGS